MLAPSAKPDTGNWRAVLPDQRDPLCRHSMLERCVNTARQARGERYSTPSVAANVAQTKHFNPVSSPH